MAAPSDPGPFPNRSALVAVLASAFAASPAIGQETLVLDPIIVTGASGPGSTGTASTSSVDRETLLDTFQGASLPTVLNTLPGVTTETTPGDPAIAVNIRGLQGDGRVVVTIDGARQNFARSDHGANGTFYADPEMLRSVEVVRGPAGVDAATGAIGGTLALRTVEAADLMDPGATQGAEFRLRAGTLTAAPTAHLAYARNVGAASSVLFAVTSARPSDYEAGDGTQVDAAGTSLSGLAKASTTFADGQTLTLSWSAIDSTFRTGDFSGIPRDNDLDTSNGVLAYTFDGAVSGDVTLYRTVTAVDQQLLDDFTDQPIGPSRSYTTTTDGLRGTATRAFALGPTDQAVTVVVDAFRDDVETDDPTAVGGSLTPSGRRQIGSVLAQDAIGFPTGTEAVVGLRFDSYRLESDDGEADGSQWSPSLTLRQAVGDAVLLHATVARAYRPPTLSETLVNGMHPPPADFYIRPNPNLKPESALTTEVGAALALSDLVLPGDSLDASLTAYRNDVEDYIGLEERGTIFDYYLQYDNIESVRIEGLELEIAYDTDRAFAGISGQLIRGIDRTTGEDVSGIAPNRLVLTGGVRSRDQALQGGARLTVTGAREDALLSSDSWYTLDLFLTRAIGDRGSLGLALNNITNQTYTQYLNTQPSPGFNALASLTITF